MATYQAKPTILVVDDETRMLRMESRLLQLEGYSVIAAEDAHAALETLESESIDLVILDLMLPDLDGYELCRRIRESSRVPIVMVTARHTTRERVKGFQFGADDYVSKPFDPEELALRVKAVLSRAVAVAGAPPSPCYRCCDLTVDFTRGTVNVGGRDVPLTGTEYRLVSYLTRNAGRLLTSNEILRNVWGPEYQDDISLLQMYISRLRRRLGDTARSARYITTRPGIGYVFMSGDSQSPNGSPARPQNSAVLLGVECCI